jgi:hypothetical protein
MAETPVLMFLRGDFVVHYSLLPQNPYVGQS